MIRIIQGDCRDGMAKLPDKSVHCCVTSPPYFGLRDYGTAEWEGGDPDCDHQGQIMRKHHISDNKEKPREFYKSECGKCGALRKDEQLGLEETPEEFVEALVSVFREVRRVLRDDGTVWLNLGDSYGRDKNLIGIPWRVAFALQADGWYLRQDIIWNKPNVMPEACKDRCTKSHEYIFLLSKQPKYFYDLDAIREPVKEASIQRSKTSWNTERPSTKTVGGAFSLDEMGERFVNPDGRNKRSVWTVTTKSFKDAHFATFPTDLIEPCVKAGCPEMVCVDCGTPYEREVDVKRVKRSELDKSDPRYRPNSYDGAYGDINGKADAGYSSRKTVGFKKACSCETDSYTGGTVLDPFGGSGTTGLVADRLGRDAILTELNPDYIKIAIKRIEGETGLFADVRVD